MKLSYAMTVDLMSLSRKEVNEVSRLLNKKANERVNSLLRANLENTPALEALRPGGSIGGGYEFKVKRNENVSARMFRIARAREFLNYETSTVRGAKKYVNFFNNDEFLKVYDKFINDNPIYTFNMRYHEVIDYMIREKQKGRKVTFEKVTKKFIKPRK